MKGDIKSKTFKTGGSVAVRIPKKFNLHVGDDVSISSPSDGVIILKVKEQLWENRLRAAVKEAQASGLWDDFEIPNDDKPEPVDIW